MYRIHKFSTSCVWQWTVMKHPPATSEVSQCYYPVSRCCSGCNPCHKRSEVIVDPCTHPDSETPLIIKELDNFFHIRNKSSHSINGCRYNCAFVAHLLTLTVPWRATFDSYWAADGPQWKTHPAQLTNQIARFLLEVRYCMLQVSSQTEALAKLGGELCEKEAECTQVQGLLQDQDVTPTKTDFQVHVVRDSP
jgi:hypothetical protein